MFCLAFDLKVYKKRLYRYPAEQCQMEKQYVYAKFITAKLIMPKSHTWVKINIVEVTKMKLWVSKWTW